MRLRAIGLFVLFTAASLPANAQTPTPGGGKETIQFLYDALMALTARVDKLEGRTEVTAADLVGTYVVSGIETEMFAPDSGFPTQFSHSVDAGTLTLSAAGMGTFDFVGDGSTLWLNGLGPQLSQPAVTPFGGTPEQGAFPWTYNNGTLLIPGAIPFHVAAGGRVLIGVGADHLTGGGHDVLLILTRR
jgi:hypothetical protein